MTLYEKRRKIRYMYHLRVLSSGKYRIRLTAIFVLFIIFLVFRGLRRFYIVFYIVF